MLNFTCEWCKKEFEIEVAGMGGYTYRGSKNTFIQNTEQEPCRECQDKVVKAGKKVLEDIKKTNAR